MELHSKIRYCLAKFSLSFQALLHDEAIEFHCLPLKDNYKLGRWIYWIYSELSKYTLFLLKVTLDCIFTKAGSLIATEEKSWTCASMYALCTALQIASSNKRPLNMVYTQWNRYTAQNIVETCNLNLILCFYSEKHWFAYCNWLILFNNHFSRSSG